MDVVQAGRSGRAYLTGRRARETHGGRDAAQRLEAGLRDKGILAEDEKLRTAESFRKRAVSDVCSGVCKMPTERRRR